MFLETLPSPPLTLTSMDVPWALTHPTLQIVRPNTPLYNDEETVHEAKANTTVLFHLGVLQKTSFIHCSSCCCCVASNATHRGIRVLLTSRGFSIEYRKKSHDYF